MKKISVIAATLVGGAVLCAAPISLHQAQDKGLTLSVDKARAAYRAGYYGRGYGYHGYRHHPYAAAQAAAPGQLTCKQAAKLQFPNEHAMRKAFKKECKQAYKASRTRAAG